VKLFNITVNTASAHNNVEITGESVQCDGVTVTLSGGRGINIEGQDTAARVVNCSVSNAATTGIRISNAPASVVQDSVVADCGTSGAANNHDGIAIADGSHGTMVRRARVYRQKSGLGTGIDSQSSTVGEADPVRIEQCVCIDCENASFATTGVPPNYLDSCLSVRPGKYGLYVKTTNTAYARRFTSLSPGRNHIKSGDTDAEAHTLAVTRALMSGKAGGPDVFHNEVGTLTIVDSIYPVGATFSRLGVTNESDYTAWLTAGYDTNTEELDAVVDDSGNTSADVQKGTWIAGMRALDDLPESLNPDCGAAENRSKPGRRFGVGGGTL